MNRRFSPISLIGLLLILPLFSACSDAAESSDRGYLSNSLEPQEGSTTFANGDEAGEIELATFGAGCFWCVEAVFQRIEGVEAVTSGYMGGTAVDPTYEQVITGETGHAEVIQIRFAPAVVGYDELLSLFWRMHDPTTLNRQGADVGTQYRSAIFYHTEVQKEAAERSKNEATASGTFNDPIVTEIVAAQEFYEAEEYHQDYFNKNPQAAYCQLVIVPKLNELNLME